tara:strand:- start:2364 stop:2774 length:411 start_codon:yes stop_codon:yes gene_type:complete
VALRNIRIADVDDESMMHEARLACPWSAFRSEHASRLHVMHRERSVGVCEWGEDEFVAALGLLYVRSDRRRFGLGGALLDAAVDRIRARGVRQIEARYRTGDASSEGLFASRGFNILGEEADGVWTIQRVEKRIKS